METGFQKKYACTMVDIHTGIGIAVACMNPDAKATIQTLARWCSHYWAPRIIDSDQGSYLIAGKVQKLAQRLDIQWNFHLAYNPMALGNIERFNGLIKIELKTTDKTTLQETLVFNLNQREKPWRSVTHEVLTQPSTQINIERKQKKNKFPHKVTVRGYNLSQWEVIADADGNT